MLIFYLAKPLNAANLIGPGDFLNISVYGHEDLKTETRVGDDGLINFPLIGEVSAGGKSSMELEEAIAIKLIQDGFIHDAQVSVVVTEHISQLVSVVGQVFKPGRYQMETNSSAIDLIAMAGGINDTGDDKVIHTRTVEGKPQKQVINLNDVLNGSENAVSFALQPGDVLYVPKAPMFYVYGEVQHPGTYRLQVNTSVVQALSMGGGLTPRGSDGRIVIKRRDNKGELKEIDVELSDTVLQDDVIYVGERWF